MPLLPAVPGLYPTAVARLLRGLALAGQARAGHGDERGDLLSELDEVTRWLAARAADAPDNFLHLLRLLEAERAWAVGDFRAAALAFDAARARGRRPSAPVASGPDHRTRGPLLPGPRRSNTPASTCSPRPARSTSPGARPRRSTNSTGPTRPCGHMPTRRRRIGAARPAIFARPRSTVTTGTIDLLGILSASQALSSETSIDRLHARVVEVLGAMTGATGVHLLLWSDDRHDWLLPDTRRRRRARSAAPATSTSVPMSVLRYVQRTR